jgi:flagellar operon protein
MNNPPMERLGVTRSATSLKPMSGNGYGGMKQIPVNRPSFQQIYQNHLITKEQAAPLKLSHHAQVRMQQRGIELDEATMVKMQEAVRQAAAKGAKESLILMQNHAFIVSVNNRTVVTAMDANDLTDHVVTQIDSAVIIPTTPKGRTE